MKLKLGLLALLVSGQCLADVDAVKYGKDRSYPYSELHLLSEQDPYLVSEYSGQRFEDQNRHPGFNNEAHWVRKTSDTTAIPSANVDWPWLRNPDSWVERYPILAVIVYKEGKIIYEKYQYDRKPNHRFRSQSMAKTLTAIAVGIAVDEGKVDIDKTADTYLPELKGYPLGKVTVRNHLKMSSGSTFDWNPKGDARTYYLNKFAPEFCNLDVCGIDVRDRWKKETQKIDQGKIWNYDPQSSDILSAIVGRVYNKPMSKVWEEKVWSKLGPERDAVWRKLWHNDFTSGANAFYATPRDWIKISTLWFDNRNIVSKKWLEQIYKDTITIKGHKSAVWSKNNNPDSYGYQTWVREGKWFAMAGHRGQKVFVDPKSKTTMFVSSIQGEWSKEGIEWFEWLTEKNLDSLIK